MVVATDSTCSHCLSPVLCLVSGSGSVPYRSYPGFAQRSQVARTVASGSAGHPRKYSPGDLGRSPTRGLIASHLGVLSTVTIPARGGRLSGEAPPRLGVREVVAGVLRLLRRSRSSLSEVGCGRPLGSGPPVELGHQGAEIGPQELEPLGLEPGRDSPDTR